MAGRPRYRPLPETAQIRLGALARGAREALGFDIRQVGEALGINPACVSAFERASVPGHIGLGRSKIARLAELLRCPSILEAYSYTTHEVARRAKIARLEEEEALGTINLGGLLWLRRQLRGWTRSRMAELASVSTRVISSVEHHEAVPSEEVLKRLGGILGCDLDMASRHTHHERRRERHRAEVEALESVPYETLCLGARVRLARLKRGLTIKDAARISGYSVNVWSAIENGHIDTPWNGTLEAIATTLHEPRILQTYRDALTRARVPRSTRPGEALRMLRKVCGLSRSLAAHEFGVSEATLKRWERYEQTPREDTRARVRAVLGFDPWLRSDARRLHLIASILRDRALRRFIGLPQVLATLTAV